MKAEASRSRFESFSRHARTTSERHRLQESLLAPLLLLIPRRLLQLPFSLVLVASWVFEEETTRRGRRWMIEELPPVDGCCLGGDVLRCLWLWTLRGLWKWRSSSSSPSSSSWPRLLLIEFDEFNMRLAPSHCASYPAIQSLHSFPAMYFWI